MSLGFEDDKTILDEELLYRRIPPDFYRMDAESGVWRPISAAFADHQNGSPMSIVLGSELKATGREPPSLIANFPGYALVMVTAGFVRSLGLGIIRSPLVEEPAHAEIFGKKTDSVRRKLSRGSNWVVPPSAVQE